MSLVLVWMGAGGGLSRVEAVGVVQFAVQGEITNGVPCLSVQEQAPSLQVVVERTGDVSGRAQVGYLVTDDTATAGADYSSIMGGVLFEPGETNKTIELLLLDDKLAEDTEFFDVTLREPSQGTVLGERRRLRVGILDSEGGFRFGTSAIGVEETVAGVTLEVVRGKRLLETATVDYYTTNVSAKAGEDYTAVSGTLIFQPGDTRRTLRVPILNDGQTEPAESFRVLLANPSAGMGLDEGSIAEVTIADNDVGVHFATAELRSEEHGGPVYLTVIRGSDGTEPIAVEYATIDGTAIGGVDYVAAAGLITFGPGEVSKSIAIEILDDRQGEDDESLTVELRGGPAGVGLGTPSTVALTILNDDEPLILDAPPLTEKSGSTNLLIRWRNDGPRACLLTYSATGGTATPGEDYLLPSGTLELPPGAVTASIPLVVVDDPVAESGETIELTCAIPAEGITNTFTLTLADDEKLVFVDGRFQLGAPERLEVHRLLRDAEGRLLVDAYDFSAGADTLRRFQADGTPDLTFRCGISNVWIQALALEPGGCILCGLDGPPFLVRLQTNGVLDAAFVPGWPAGGGAVCQLALQPNGRIIAARFAPSGGGWNPRIYGLLPSGALDPGFTQVDVSAADSPWVSALQVVPAGGILVAGTFDAVGGLPRSGVALLQEKGGVDPAFDVRLSPVEGERLRVETIALCPDGRVLVAGNFSSVHGVPRVGLARIRSDGSLDGSFDARFEAAGRIRAMAVQPDGRALVAGDWLPVPDMWGADLIRLTVDGRPDPSLPFLETDGQITTLAFGSGLTLYVGGLFQRLNGIHFGGLARVFLESANLAGVQFTQADFRVLESASTAILTVERLGSTAGTLSVEWASVGGQATPGIDYRTASGTLTFGPLENTKAFAIEILDDGLAEGEENVEVALKTRSADIVLGQPSVAQIVIVDNEVPAVLDRSFQPARTLAVERAFLLLPDGRVLVAGELLDANDQRVSGIIRLEPDGSQDESYAMVRTDGTPACLAAGAGGKVLAGGWFGTVNGQPRQGVVQLDADGNIDPQFAPVGISGVSRLAVDALGRVLLIAEGQVRRLLANGALDSTFRPVSDMLSGPACLAPLADGKSLIAGDGGIVRLNEDGSADAGFHGVQLENPVWGWTSVRAILPLADGRIVIGGVFTKVDGADCGGLARLNADGTLDGSFMQGVGFRWDYSDGWSNPGEVTALAVAPDGGVLVAGLFNTAHGVPQGQLVRLTADGALDPSMGEVQLLCPG